MIKKRGNTRRPLNEGHWRRLTRKSQKREARAPRVFFGVQKRWLPPKNAPPSIILLTTLLRVRTVTGYTFLFNRSKIE